MSENFLVTFCIFFGILLINCYANGKKKQGQEITQFHKALGLHISTDRYIQKYEREHHMMYRNDDGTINKAKYLKSQSKLASKHPLKFCLKYLKAVIPKRDITGLHGNAVIVQLLYTQEELDGRGIFAIKCDLPITETRSRALTYYIAEAPQHCAYTIIRVAKGSSLFKIVSKICDFENDNSPDFKYTRNNLKIETGGLSRTHKRTGIPVACDDLIEKYEYQHQEMYRNKSGTTDIEKYLTWPVNREKNCVTAVCFHYLKYIVPVRAKDMIGMIAIVEQGRIKYNLKNKGFIQLINVIHCQLPSVEDRRGQLNYYVTEAPHKNCVFTLLRLTRGLVFKIVFHVCGFIEDNDDSKNGVDMINDFQSYSPNSPKRVAQGESDNQTDLKTLQILPRD